MRAASRGFGILAGLVLLGIAAEPSPAQQVTVSGVVVVSETGAPIGGADVRLGERPAAITGLDGTFRFDDVTPGSHTLRIDALGYRSQSLELEVRADTTLRIELDLDPVVLDTLFAEPREVTIHGSVRDAETGRRISALPLEVRVQPGGRSIGGTGGRFTIDDVIAGEPTTLTVEVFEYLPARIALIAESDTTLDIALERDSIALRMIEPQIERLEVRTRRVSFPVIAYRRDDILRSGAWSVREFTRRKLGESPRDTRGVHDHPCVFLDDSKIGYNELNAVPPDDIERVEIYSRGRMIRVYTRRYMRRLVTGRVPRARFEALDPGCS